MTTEPSITKTTSDRLFYPFVVASVLFLALALYAFKREMSYRAYKADIEQKQDALAKTAETCRYMDGLGYKTWQRACYIAARNNDDLKQCTSTVDIDCDVGQSPDVAAIGAFK